MSIDRKVRSGHRQRVYVAVFIKRVAAISCSRSTVAVGAPNFVGRCELVLNSLQTSCYDPLSHSRHNAGDRSTKVGHAINW